MEYEVQRCTRHCATSGREFSAGESFYSILVADGAELRRHDYSVSAWTGPPDGAIAWWKSQVPDRHTRQKLWAPNDVMLQFFDELADQPDKQDMRYVLSLLLVRRRVVQLEANETDPQGRANMVLYCPRRDATYRVSVATPEPSRVEAIQQELVQLLQ